MNILRIHSSARGTEAASYQLSQLIVDQWLSQLGDTAVAIDDLHADSLPHPDAPYSAALRGGEDPAEADGSLPLSDQLISQLRAADALILAAPMHNFTVPSALKAWIDHVVRIRHTFVATAEGKVGTLSDRPVYVAISTGGRLRGGRQPDFMTPYLKAVLEVIGLHQVQFFYVESTAMPDPQLRQAAWQQAVAEVKAHFA
ncbi:NAD(P)H dehydrogenase [Pokkaliibacter plantistimulans]|uniref:FMN dependent NADH:quinone oxidoreductase n=1 Tax=Proteobacteria bacterium 228 TaxID=2083153 RepID=A0A2S5KVL2_9PROT|nr:NAD(P)H-dependent oxidoreductase [Pokkaliibacter plantistimulans]PPC78897.1 NAD(P)H dehydrogenase [Pokkaliibacter plantistimulans]